MKEIFLKFTLLLKNLRAGNERWTFSRTDSILNLKIGWVESLSLQFENFWKELCSQMARDIRGSIWAIWVARWTVLLVCWLWSRLTLRASQPRNIMVSFILVIMLKKPYAIASIYHTRCLMAPKAKILNLKCNTFPLSMNIWTKQARRLASEFKKMIMKSKRGHWDQRAKQRRGLWSPYGFLKYFVTQLH